ncbi:UNVERIFIED_CONTAM: hypothetical protein GTU68_067145 [Idotea baltica]|nr:hypothetical protein [Idotea baltica]
MLTYIVGNSLELILALSSIALVLLVLRLLRRKKRAGRKLEKDKSGYWRYHKDTEFDLVRPFELELLEEKPKEKKKDDTSDKKNSIAVIRFEGDLRAKGHEGFARLVDEVIVNKDSFSELVVIVNSPGGMVAPYGRLYSEMERIRDAGILLSVCVDVVAASGGYLMSVPANKIVAAPFATVGSVGVVAFIPNIREMLESVKIRPRTFTAGKFKRTVSLTDEATPEEIAHFQEDLETIQRMFSSAVKKYRPQIDLEKVETGDNWSATESVELGLGLVDEVATSSAYLLEKNRKARLVHCSQKKGFLDGKVLPFGIGAYDYLESRLYSLWRNV